MALITCPECKTDVSDTAKSCPKCGAKLKGSTLIAWLIGAPIVVIAAVLLLGAFPSSDSDKDHARRAVELCKEDLQRPGQENATLRFIDNTCRAMEADFRRKYGVNP